MKFYYVNDDNEVTVVKGSNKEIYEQVSELAKKEKSNTGVIGAIGKDKLRAMLLFHAYEKTVYTKISQFIRKHAARAALEELCNGQ